MLPRHAILANDGISVHTSRFSILGRWRGVTLLVKNLLITPSRTPPPPPPHARFTALPLLNSFSCYNPIKTSFLAVDIAPVRFYSNFIPFVNTGHAKFDFNRCSVFTECGFNL